MTINILSTGAQLDLPLDVELNIETTSPIFSQASSMSLPISIPLTDQNRRALNYPDVLNIYDPDTTGIRTIDSMQVVVKHGSWQQMATMDISSCTETAAEATLYFNESNIWSKIEDVTLPQAMAGLHYGNIPPSTADIPTYRQNLIDALCTDFGSYPTMEDIREDDHYQGEISYTEWTSLLTARSTWFQARDFVMAPIHTEDGWLNEIVCPNVLRPRTNGNYMTAFLRLDFILHKIFEKAGYSLVIDFDSYPDDGEYSSHFEKQWHSIIVLNNTMDALYPGCMYYGTLVPEISCKDFLLAVQAQFGCAFFYQPDGTYIMKFVQSLLDTAVGSRISHFNGLQVAFNSAPEYNPADNMEKAEKADMIYAELPDTYYDSSYSSGQSAWDAYPNIHTISLEGVCQRTTTTATDGEDSTKDKKCPLVFVTMDFAIIFHTEYDQQERPHTTTESYPAIRKPYVEILDEQVQPEDISRELRGWYFYDLDGLYQLLNKAYTTAIESCDKVTITRMMSTRDIALFDFAQPLIVKNRLCWPLKLQYKLQNLDKQQVTIELVGPHKS